MLTMHFQHEFCCRELGRSLPLLRLGRQMYTPLDTWIRRDWDRTLKQDDVAITKRKRRLMGEIVT